MKPDDQGSGVASAQHDLNHIAEALRPLAVPIEQLTPDPANARKHDERNLAAIEASLVKFGQRLPLVVQKQGMIVRAGNGRLEVARKLGWTHVACVVVDEANVDATAYAIADNRTAELAEWDNAVLADLLKSLPDDVLISTGFDDKELSKLIGEDQPQATSVGDIAYRVVVLTKGEADQAALFERLTQEGYECQLLMS